MLACPKTDFEARASTFLLDHHEAGRVHMERGGNMHAAPGVTSDTSQQSERCSQGFLRASSTPTRSNRLTADGSIKDNIEEASFVDSILPATPSPPSEISSIGSLRSPPPPFLVKVEWPASAPHSVVSSLPRSISRLHSVPQATTSQRVGSLTGCFRASPRRTLARAHTIVTYNATYPSHPSHAPPDPSQRPRQEAGSSRIPFRSTDNVAVSSPPTPPDPAVSYVKVRFYAETDFQRDQPAVDEKLSAGEEKSGLVSRTPHRQRRKNCAQSREPYPTVLQKVDVKSPPPSEPRSAVMDRKLLTDRHSTSLPSAILEKLHPMQIYEPVEQQQPLKMESSSPLPELPLVPGLSKVRKQLPLSSKRYSRRTTLQLPEGTPCAVDTTANRCSICKDGRIWRFTDLRRHMDTHFPKQAAWRCVGVGRADAEAAGLNPLWWQKTIVDADGVERVGGCGATFSRADALNRHIRSAQGCCIGYWTSRNGRKETTKLLTGGALERAMSRSVTPGQSC